MPEITDIQKVDALNEVLVSQGLLPLALISPLDCIEQKRNARYMDRVQMERLIENIRGDKRLESVPLVDAPVNGKYGIISGHHRVKAAVLAGVGTILVMVCDCKSRDELVSKQLAHNALSGKDDPSMLVDLFDSIQDLSLKLATGLNDEIAKITFEAINFRGGDFREFTIAFLPEDEGLFDEAMEEIAEQMTSKNGSGIRMTSMEYFERFGKVLTRLKKTENIKSNGIAFMRMVELAQERMMEIVSDATE